MEAFPSDDPPASPAPSRPRPQSRTRSQHRRRKPWRKLLWVNQDYPDNWVDPSFLSQLQRNINVHPYDFYSLISEFTVIVQHVSSVVIFLVSFIAIYRAVVSPVSVVALSSVLTIVGWAIWDLGFEKREATTERTALAARAATTGHGGGSGDGASSPGGFELSASSTATPSPATKEEEEHILPLFDKEQARRARHQRILSTAKSALLIYFTLLGLSPILRSLTKSISSDSVWAIATWLFIANVLGFDYGSGVERKFPASFSTNAAITSSVVLASRLPDTTHVFSLILFSIQVFGLFPVFRRYVRFVSWNYHVALTVVLVGGAAAGLGAVMGSGWAVAWVLAVVGGMGGCGWWMLDLQKYKNEIHGPWDPARPVIRSY